MLKRTAPERWLARHGRHVALAALLAMGYVCGVAVSGVVLAEQLFQPPRRDITAADIARARAMAKRTSSQMTSEPLQAGDGAVLRAWWFVPHAPSRGTVIVLHGQGDNRAAMLGLTDLLLQDGYRVLAPDARAHGSSSGAAATYGIRERDDLRAWAEWAQRQFPDQCVFGAGASMGAAILIQTLPDVPFCAAVADSSFADLPELATWRIAASLHLPHALQTIVAGPIVSAGMWYARVWHGIPLAAASPARRLAAARVPVLVIHGTADREIPVSDARLLAAANPRFVTLWLVEGATHTQAWAASPREYPARVLAFLAAHQ
jgi:alpha-beta hydrolase superfamily lysophospholipase